MLCLEEGPIWNSYHVKFSYDYRYTQHYYEYIAMIMTAMAVKERFVKAKGHQKQNTDFGDFMPGTSPILTPNLEHPY